MNNPRLGQPRPLTVEEFTEQASEYLAVENLKHPVEMAWLPGPHKLPYVAGGAALFEVWRSRDFLAQVFSKENGGQRISVNRTTINSAGEWADGITWDDLQRIKHEIGRGDSFAVEIYPANGDVVNVANIRHLWLLDSPPPFAWIKHGS